MKRLLAVFFFVLSYPLLANSLEDLSPEQVIKQTGDRLFSSITQQQQQLAKFPDLMRDIVAKELMPSIDHQYAAYKILGKHLKSTTKEQRDNFSDSMQHYLIKTYAAALNQYTDQKVTYFPGQLSNSKKMATVPVVISEQGKPDIHLSFKMRLNKRSAEWKAYDLVVEGISLLNSKQAEFNSRINKYGLDQVTIELAALTD